MIGSAKFFWVAFFFSASSFSLAFCFTGFAFSISAALISSSVGSAIPVRISASEAFPKYTVSSAFTSLPLSSSNLLSSSSVSSCPIVLLSTSVSVSKRSISAVSTSCFNCSDICILLSRNQNKMLSFQLLFFSMARPMRQTVL